MLKAMEIATAGTLCCWLGLRQLRYVQKLEHRAASLTSVYKLVRHHSGWTADLQIKKNQYWYGKLTKLQARWKRDDAMRTPIGESFCRQDLVALVVGRDTVRHLMVTRVGVLVRENMAASTTS